MDNSQMLQLDIFDKACLGFCSKANKTICCPCRKVLAYVFFFTRFLLLHGLWKHGLQRGNEFVDRNKLIFPPLARFYFHQSIS